MWWGDERCVPPDDERSNFRLAQEALLTRLERPPAAIHRIEGERGPHAAAESYDRKLRTLAEREGRPTLGLVLLGVGADGHTASLFPNSAALAEREQHAFPVTERSPPRVTLTRRALAAAETIAFLVTGEDKAQTVSRAFANEPDEAIPASLVRARGRTVALLDAAAAALLDLY